MVKRVLLSEIYLLWKPSSFLVSEQLFDWSLFGLLKSWPEVSKFLSDHEDGL